MQSILKPGLLELAAEAGMRSCFVGLETLSEDNLREQNKGHNLNRDYGEAIRRLHGSGVMMNASFVFGMDEDDASVFGRTVEWAVKQGIETATFHIMTPYPGTALYAKMRDQKRLLHSDWDRYDTRQAVFAPAKMTPQVLEAGYWRAYRDFYSWRSIAHSASAHEGWGDRARHFAYAGGWKKFEPLWDCIIRARRATSMLPVLEQVLSSFGSRHGARRAPNVAKVA